MLEAEDEVQERVAKYWEALGKANHMEAENA